jgi:hypothetical protein
LYINEVTGTGFAPLDWREQEIYAGRQKLAAEIERQRAERGDEWFAAEFARRLENADEETRAELLRRLDEYEAGAVASDRTGNGVGRSVYADESGTLRSTGDPPDFVDLIPERPLMQALYSRKHALDLLEGTGWEVVSLNPPEPHYIQHYFVCRPA